MFGVYTLIDPAAAEAALRRDGSGELEEGRRWVRALVVQQESTGRLPLLLADASSINGVQWVGEIDRIEPRGGRTRVSFSQLVRLHRPIPLQELIKDSTGEPLSGDYIRPYVPCRLTDAQLALIEGARRRGRQARPRAAAEQEKRPEHFLAYHNARKNGYSLKPASTMRFFSTKSGVLQQAIGNFVWVIQGVPDVDRKTGFELLGVHRATEVLPTDVEGRFEIRGEGVRLFDPPRRLNGLPWFERLFETQRNFSLGFSRIGDGNVVQALADLLGERGAEVRHSELPDDVDLLEVGTEGAQRLVTHLRRERDRGLVRAKKAQVLREQGRLWCEACGLDFISVYGPGGERCCEAHHINPLSKAQGTVKTHLDELALLCSSCHRVIHGTEPMMSVQDLSKMLRLGLSPRVQALD